MDSRAETPSADELLAHAAFVRRLALGLVGDAHEAEDVAQETLLRAFERPPAIFAGTRAWLAVVARNVVRMRRRADARRARRESALARPEAPVAAADSAATMEILRRVTAAVDGLGEPCRAAVLLRYYEGLGPSEIARRTGDPVKTVKTRLHRALARLRARLDEEHGDRRAWTLALLPLAGKGPAGLAPVVSGAILMTMKTKLGLAVAAAVLAAVAVTLAVRDGDGPTVPAEPTATPSARATADDPAPTPVPPSAASEAAAAAPVTPRESPSRHLGRVRVAVVDDATGEPVPGVVVHRHRVDRADFLDEEDESEVALFIRDAIDDEERTARSLADAEGRAVLDASPGPWLLFVRHPRYRDALGERFPLRAGEERSVEIRLRPYPEAEREIDFGGAVTDGETTGPLPGVAVECRFLDGSEVRSLAARTGKDGRYSLRVPANARLALRYRLDGYDPHDLSVNPSHEPWISGDVVLVRVDGGPARGEGRLTGRVTDAATGEPVAGAELSLERGLDANGNGGIGGWGGWQSGDDGRYRIDLRPVDASEELMRLVVRRPGFAEHRSELLSIAPDRTTEHAVALAREEVESAFRGTVTDAATDGPLAGATVRSVDVFGEARASANTDAEGRFRLPVRGEEERILIGADGYAEAERDASPDASEALDVALVRANARVAGTVVDAATGKPLAGARLSLYRTPEWTGPGPTTITDEAGGYRFAFAPGRYLVQARRDGYGPDYLRTPEIAAEATFDGDFALHAMDAVVTGHVRDAASGAELPAAAEEVFLLRMPVDDRDALVSEMAGLHPPIEVEVDGARYSARVAPGRYELSIGLAGYRRLEREIDVRAGQRLDLDLEVTPVTAAGEPGETRPDDRPPR